MSSSHPSRDLLVGFFDGRLPDAENRQVVRHLIEGCSECSHLSRQLWPVTEPPSDADRTATLSRHEERSYANAVANALGAIEGRQVDVEKERAAAPALMDELLAVPLADRSGVASAERRFHSWCLVDQLVKHSFGEGFCEPVQALEIAQTAVSLAAMLKEDKYGSGLVNDLLARSWLQLGNARRVNGDLAGATHDMQLAESYLRKGTGDPMDRAWLLRLEADLEGERRDFVAVSGMLSEALDIYRRLGEDHLAGCTLIDLGTHLGEAGETARAIELLREGLEAIDPDDARHQLMARHNLVLHLLAENELEAATSLLEEARPLYGQVGGAVTEARRRWLEGRIAMARERLEEAEMAFLEVREVFRRREIAHDMAFVDLDLALLYLRQGHTQRIKLLAAEMLDVFRARKTHREAVAAIMLFRDAAALERLSVEWIKELARFLESSSRNPKVKFRPPR